MPFSIEFLDTSVNFTVERFYQIYRAKKSQDSIPISDLLNRMLILPAVDIYEVFMQLTRFPALLNEMSSNELVRSPTFHFTIFCIIDSEIDYN